MVEISKAFEYENFASFDRKRYPKNLKFAGMLQYDGDLKLPAKYLVPPPFIERTSGEYMVKNGMSIFACSETQKFGHVTFFWNGNRSGYFDETKETYVEIPSDKCPFNEKPDMKTREITGNAPTSFPTSPVSTSQLTNPLPHPMPGRILFAFLPWRRGGNCCPEERPLRSAENQLRFS